MAITDVRIVTLHAELPAGLRRRTRRSVRMQDMFQQPERWENHESVTRHYVELDVGDELTATYGPVSDTALPSIRSGLAALLLGADPGRHALLWEQMHRSERHLRSGYGMMGLSALDNLLWDARGRMTGQPVFRLLGGATRDRVPAYVSALGRDHDRASLAVSARDFAETFDGQKWFFAAGPADGPAALDMAVELVRTLREVVGTESPLMFDAVMGWDLALARRWADRVSDLDPTWLEEPFPSWDLESYRTLAGTSSVPLAAGEHIYGRWEASTWLTSRALGYLQCDPDWCGGLSEFVRIATLTSTSATTLVPHGANVHAALHAAFALPATVVPRIEWLIELADERAFFEKHPVRPDGGSFGLPTRPGFGIELVRERAERTTTWSATSAE